jgi:hypothetical protein
MSSCMGRAASGYIAGFIGVSNMMIIVAILSGLIILGTIGLGSLSSVVILGVLYGASLGVCK